MKFRIDILDSKIDLSKFRAAAKVYMGQMERLEFDIFLASYKISIEIDRVEGHTQRMVTIQLWDVVRNPDKSIKSFTPIYPLRDTRFQEIKIIKEMFIQDIAQAKFESTDAAQTTQKLEALIKTIHKINNLKAFI